MLRFIAVALHAVLTLVVSFIAGGLLLFALAAVLGGREEVIGIFYLIVAPAAVVGLVVFGLVRGLGGRSRAVLVALAVLLAVLAGAGAFLWATSTEPSALAPGDSDALTITMIVLPPALVFLVQALMLKPRA